MKKVLHIVPHTNFFPPNNGGALRCYHLSQELARFFEVSLVTPQMKESFVSTNGYTWNKSIAIIAPRRMVQIDGLLNKIINAVRYRYYKRSMKGPAEILILQVHDVLCELLKQQTFDVVIFEHLSAMSLSPFVRRLAPFARQLVDMHNVDHLLYAQEHAISVSPFKQQYKTLRYIESNIYKQADSFLCCSEHDRSILEALNQYHIQGHVIPNGADTRNCRIEPIVNRFSKRLLFCGSLDYKPNQEGLVWFFHEVWPFVKSAIPEIDLTIIGRGNNQGYDWLSNDPSIRFIGQVDSVVSYYQECTVAIVPLLSGSGTRLKILEAMSFGNPVVSTAKGAEGIEYKHGYNIFIADESSTFAQAIITILNNIEIASDLSIHARALIEEKYSWQIVGKRLKNIIESFTKQ